MQRYSVNLYPHEIEALIKGGALHETQKESGVFYLDERYYNKDVGVVLDPKESMDFLNG